jgi:ADP-ribose pyrophosphatase YjhB (NUDIX family)
MADVDRIRIYRYCPRCAAEAMSVRGEQLVVCGACGLHLYYNPCAAVGAFLVDREARVLFTRRAKDPSKGKLGLPGGFIDNAESAEAGLRREVREEIGLEVGALEFLCSQPNTYPYGGIIYPTLDFYFIARVDDFAAARALDEVQGLVVRRASEVTDDELAFPSLKAAWTVYRLRHAS